LPTGFLPEEDQGYFFVNIQLPDAASLNRTESVIGQVRELLNESDSVKNVITVAGFSMLSGAQSSNTGMAIAVLKPWGERTRPEQTVQGLIARMTPRFATIAAANVVAFNPPSIPGLGTAGGFDMRLQGLEGQTPPEIGRAFTTFSASVPRTRPRPALGRDRRG
jgi:multidrug efflux pump